ncbi:MAG: 4Fe-4S dicluster domain-containing protein [Betaproteobacteria bacterium]|nr:4Fe-4S dicluster domain-containing protein [Betaproteobacteria bacterium]
MSTGQQVNNGVGPVSFARRKVVGALAALGGVAIAPGLVLYEFAQAAPDAGKSTGASSKVRWGMLIDTTLCTPGCTACVDACRTENGLGPVTRATDVQWIRKVELKDRKTGAVQSAPVMCQHCAEPPCVDVCPTGASFKRADGIVLVDRHTCIGCRYCVMACPYMARSFVHEPITEQKTEVPRGKGCVESCTLCVQRVDRGSTPACVEACTAIDKGAMVFGDLNDPQSDIARRIRARASVQIRADLRLDTGVRYQGL